MKTLRVMISLILGVSALILGGAFYSNGQAQAKTVTEKPAIVLDLGGVVFDTDESQFKRNEISSRTALFYGIRTVLHGQLSKAKISRHIRKRWYGTLTKASQYNNNSFELLDSKGNMIAMKDDLGLSLPAYMMEWMCGNRPNIEIKTEISNAIAANPSWFTMFEQTFMSRMARGIYTPERFAASRVRIESTIKLAKKLKKQGHPVYVLSNWDAESFAIMREKHADFFDLLDGWMISGEVHTAKPSPDIYELFMQKYPHDCYCFLDDQQANIDAATACGWCAIKTVTRKPDIKQIKHEIAALSSSGNERIA